MLALMADGGEYRAADLAPKCGLDAQTVATTLCGLARDGRIDRLGRGRYRRTEI